MFININIVLTIVLNIVLIILSHDLSYNCDLINYGINNTLIILLITEFEWERGHTYDLHPLLTLTNCCWKHQFSTYCEYVLIIILYLL